MLATMDVYGYSLSDGQASVAAIWIGNDDGDNSDLDSIAVGWEVSCCPLQHPLASLQFYYYMTIPLRKFWHLITRHLVCFYICRFSQVNMEIHLPTSTRNGRYVNFSLWAEKIYM